MGCNARLGRRLKFSVPFGLRENFAFEGVGFTGRNAPVKGGLYLRLKEAYIKGKMMLSI